MKLSLSRDAFLWYVLPIIAFFAIALIFFSQPVDLSQAKLERFSSPLAPEVPLQIHEGESYAYTYLLGNATIRGTYSAVAVFNGCMVVQGSAVFEGQPVQVDSCIYVSNGSFLEGTQPVDFFQPWMLSLKPGFQWSEGARITYGSAGIEDVTTTTYTVIAQEPHLGRRAYRVSAVSERIFQGSSLGRAERVMWVDEEKRVLLESQAEGFSVRLTAAPFTIAEV